MLTATCKEMCYICNSTCTFSFIKRGISSHPDKHFKPTIKDIAFICV